jgi:homoserine kinase
MAPADKATNGKPKRSAKTRAVEVRLPASTSNLGAGFDCFGLALQLYLTVRATVDLKSKVKCRVHIRGGKQNASLPRNAENLIYRSIAYVAARESQVLPPLHLAVHNEIPVSRGLGSSAAAIVAGIKLFELLFDFELPNEKVLRYATEFESHADNVAATLLGGFVVTCNCREGIIAVKRSWPADIKIIVVSPELHLETKLARAALPRLINHVDGVFNLQRAALFNAALFEHRYDLLWEAMQDRLHQQKRSTLIPGLAEALAIPRQPGLLGMALSGAGPSVLALAQDHFEEIGETIAKSFARRGIKTRVRPLDIDSAGCQGRVLSRARESTSSG